MNNVIHELINMKARKIELEVELGTSRMETKHLSNAQIARMTSDLKRHMDTNVLLEMVNETISYDEWIIQNRH